MTVPFPGDYPEDYPKGFGTGPGPFQQFQTFFCQKCGAVVMVKALHKEWHDQIERNPEVSS